MSTIVKNVLYLSTSGMLQRVLSIGIFLILIRELSLSEYGILSLIVSLVTPAIAVITLGMNRLVGIELALARGRDAWSRVKALTLEFLQLNVVMTIVVAVIGVTAYLALLQLGYVPEEYQSFLVPITLFVLLQVVLNYIGGSLKNFERFGSVAIIDSIEMAGRFVAIAAAFLFSSINLPFVLTVYVGARVLAVFVGVGMFVSLFRRMVSSSEREEQVLVRIVRDYGKWGILKEILSQFTESIRLWLIQLFLNAEAVGIFSAASKLLSFIPKSVSIQSAVTPLIARKIDDHSYVSTIVTKARKYNTLYVGIASALVAFFIEDILTLVAPVYLDHTLIFQLLAIRIVIGAAFIGQEPLIAAHLKQRFLFLHFMVTFVTNILTNILFLYFFGLVGLAIAVAINMFVVNATREWYVTKALGYRNILSLRQLVTFDQYDRLMLSKFAQKFVKIARR